MNHFKARKLILLTLFIFSSFALADAEQCNTYLESKDPAVALRTLKSDPSPKAAYCAGVMYFKGIGAEKNGTKAFQWMKKAAGKNHPAAQSALGCFYHSGVVVDQNDGQAFQWFSKAAAQGDAQGQYTLSVLYYNGKDIAHDYIKAAKLIKQAYLKGDAQANKALPNFLEEIHWKKAKGPSVYALLLFTEKGEQYPDPSAFRFFNGESEQTTDLSIGNSNVNYLKVHENSTLTARVFFSECVRNENGLCSEHAAIAVFRPDWSLAGEFTDMKLLNGPPQKGEELQSGDAGITLSTNSADPKGVYHLLVTLYDADKRPVATLNQSFLLE